MLRFALNWALQKKIALWFCRHKGHVNTSTSIHTHHTPPYILYSGGSRGGGVGGLTLPPQRFFFLVSMWKFPWTWTLTPPPPSKNSGPEAPSPRRIPRSAPVIYTNTHTWYTLHTSVGSRGLGGSQPPRWNPIFPFFSIQLQLNRPPPPPFTTPPPEYQPPPLAPSYRSAPAHNM